MKTSRRHPLPLATLLRAYTDAGVPSYEDLKRLPVLGPRFRAVCEARADFLNEDFLDGAGEADFRQHLASFYQACVQPPLHLATLQRRAGTVRHALAHLLRCPDPLAARLGRCVAADGPYFVAGLGPAFWSALAQALDPDRHPGWTEAAVRGGRRLGLAGWPAEAAARDIYAALQDIHAQLRQVEPSLSALHADHFLSLVGAMQGRDLGAGGPAAGLDLAAVIRQQRAQVPLRRRLKERGRALQAGRQQVEDALAAADGTRVGAAVGLLHECRAAAARIDWRRHGEIAALWARRLWQAQDAYEILDAFWKADPVPGGGLWLATALLHLKDPRQFPVWNEPARRGYAALAGPMEQPAEAVERYRLFSEAVAWLRDRQRVHPLEAPCVLAALAGEADAAEGQAPPAPGWQAWPAAFRGFCADTFRFLRELGANNSRAWMSAQRDRYYFAVREPLVELCRALAERYVEPVLRRRWGWDIDTAARNGRALTSVCKNDYGKSVPYHTQLWIVFCRREQGLGRHDVQLFVRLDAAGLTYGLRLGREAREAGRLLRRHVQERAEALYGALCASGAVGECRFGASEDLSGAVPLAGPGDLRAWAGGKTVVAGKAVPAGSPLLASEELVGEILLTFDRLLPAYACAVTAEPEALLASGRHAGDGGAYGAAEFRRDTFLPEPWLRRARGLLDLKRQLILQGVPGTGKTHVARCLARLLAGGREEAVQLVQFHPAYSYEEFVEGIKAKSVEVNGRHEVNYPVEEGLLCALAAEAGRAPAQPHVLLIDEINRGNLPRIFGELLYLLEYRDQAVVLPYSRRAFRLPPNLYLIGTMNAADRSVALIDQALRRRFSFLEMAPDAAILSAWLKAFPPRAGAEFASSVVALFETLNTHLREDLGPLFQVGHSYFMVPGLDDSKLRAVWEHQVWPLLEEYFAGQAGRLSGYELDVLLGSERREKRQAAALT